MVALLACITAPRPCSSDGTTPCRDLIKLNALRMRIAENARLKRGKKK